MPWLASVIAVGMLALAGYAYHIVWCIQAAAENGSAIALLVVGVLVPPVGALHGICLLFGWSWL